MRATRDEPHLAGTRPWGLARRPWRYGLPIELRQRHALRSRAGACSRDVPVSCWNCRDASDRRGRLRGPRSLWMVVLTRYMSVMAVWAELQSSVACVMTAGLPEACVSTVARMPLEFQILHLMRRSKLSSKSMSEIELAWGQKLQHYLSEQAGGADDRLKEWSGNLQYMYKLAGRLVKEEIETMIAAGGGTRVDPDRLSDHNRALLMWYVSSVESWQEVVLVLEHEAEGASSSGVVINRPLRRGIDSDLAQMLLRGACSKAMACAAGLHTRE